MSHPGYRIFILGAGFSRPAGLPLASDLFSAIKSRARTRYGRDNRLQQDLDRYREYRSHSDGIDLQEDQIDLEEFMSYLDMEHYLGLRGSDTWSSDGNESQVLIKGLIGQIIQERTPPIDRLPSEYYDFASRLTVHDTVITFNYDIVLERALSHVGKPYRLFQSRYEAIGLFSNRVDNSKDELVLLKMHGSVDWFSDEGYQRMVSSYRAQGVDGLPRHAIFKDPQRFQAQPLVDGPRNPDDPLLHLYRISLVDEFYRRDDPPATPFILSPSHVKFVYSPTILDFWYGLGRAGGWNLGVSVIGFSLPKHDDYVRMALYEVITNYQVSWWNDKFFETFKDHVKLVDLRRSDEDVKAFQERYRFVDHAKTGYFFDGFGPRAVEFLFSVLRHAK